MVNPRWQALPHTDLPNLVRLGLALVVLDIDAGVAAPGIVNAAWEAPACCSRFLA